MPRITDDSDLPRAPGRLEVLRPEPQFTEVYYIPSNDAIEHLSDASFPSRVKLIEIDSFRRRLTISPIDTRWRIETFLQPKYAQIRKLTLDGQHFIDLPFNPREALAVDNGLPTDQDEVMMVLEELPSSFVKDYEYGLGFSGDFRLLPSIIEELTDASEILISDKHQTGFITGSDTFVIYSGDFDQIRKMLQRISRNGQNAFRTVKHASVHNALAQKLGLPEVEISYGRSPLRRKFTQAAIGGGPALSRSDQSVLMNAVSKHAKSIVDEQPDKLVRLQRDVELVTLDALILRFEAMIEKSLDEAQWQDFLNENRFLLGMTFGYPVILVQDQASVGGHKLSGSGDKITDFMMKNPLTNNVGIIEIKKPNSSLLYKRGYRGEVFAASRELSGAINQVIDQKHNLVSRFVQKMDDSGIYDIASYSIKCCLIIGKVPKDERQRRSFEYIRGNSKDVEIITFDEMLAKMRTIKEFLETDST